MRRSGWMALGSCGPAEAGAVRCGGWPRFSSRCTFGAGDGGLMVLGVLIGAVLLGGALIAGAVRCGGATVRFSGRGGTSVGDWTLGLACGA